MVSYSLTPRLQCQMPNAKCQNYVDSTFKIDSDSKLFSVPPVATTLVQAIMSPLNDFRSLLTGLLLPALSLVSLFTQAVLSNPITSLFGSDLGQLPILLTVKARVLTVAYRPVTFLFYLSMDLFFFISAIIVLISKSSFLSSEYSFF